MLGMAREGAATSMQRPLRHVRTRARRKGGRRVDVNRKHIRKQPLLTTCQPFLPPPPRLPPLLSSPAVGRWTSSPPPVSGAITASSSQPGGGGRSSASLPPPPLWPPPASGGTSMSVSSLGPPGSFGWRRIARASVENAGAMTAACMVQSANMGPTGSVGGRSGNRFVFSRHHTPTQSPPAASAGRAARRGPTHPSESPRRWLTPPTDRQAR